MTARACAFIAGLLIGGIIGWLWLKNRLAAASSQLDRQLAVAQAGNQALQEKLSLQKTTMEELTKQRDNSQYKD